MGELPTSIREIEAIKSKTVEADDFDLVFYENGILLIVGKEGKKVKVPDSIYLARILSALKAGRHKINHFRYIPYYEGSVECVLVDYDPPQFRGEEDV